MTFMNVSTDIVILFIPISTLVKMRLGKVELSGLIFILLMGSASVVAAISRFIVLELEKTAPRSSITHTIDVLALVEIVTSIIAVCLPSLRTFARVHSRPGLTAESRSQSGSSIRPIQGKRSVSESARLKEKRTSAGSNRTTLDSIEKAEPVSLDQAAHTFHHEPIT